MSNAVRGCRDFGLIWHGADGSQGFRRLSVCNNSARCIGVNTREVLVFTLARLESTILSIIGGVISATNSVENVLAVVRSMCSSRVASLQTESVTTHEVVPFNDLLEIFLVGTESVGIEQTTERVSTKIGTVGVKLSSVIVRLQVDLGLINKSNNLNVIGGLHELDTLEGSRREHTGTITGLRAPGNLLVLGLSDCGRSVGWSPETEVLN